ncbi:TonB-dependent receptor [Bacteroidia bacterium]|nr:TonB-dependent receptor [Bacteroidia bacterium]GHT02779.1 TonB-dependent receptor [Bacteroidia bacterium]GHT45673.1 TonB-dependent receptor [Bacteroidia bacterium]
MIWGVCHTSVQAQSGGVSNTPDSISVQNLQEVEIVSVRAGDKTPVAYSNMNKQEIEAFNFGQDIPFLLTLTPSVIATSDAGTGIGYTGFRVRGTDANRINITTNGIPLNDSESHGVFWVNMPDFASSLQDLQIQRGVGTSTNGAGAFGASINMKTGSIPLESYGEFDGGYGSFNTAKAAFKLGTGIINDHWAFDGRISSITSDGFIDRAGVDLKSYFAQGAYFNENTLLKFITFGGKEKTYHAWDGVPDYILSDIFMKDNRSYNPSGYMGDDENGNPLYYKNQTDNYRQTHYQFSLLQKLNSHLNLNAALHYTKGLGYYEEYKTGRTLEEYGLQVDDIKKSDLVRRKHLDNDFYGGIFSLDYFRDQWKVSLGGGMNQYDGNHFGKVIWVKEELGNTNHEYYRSTGKKTDANVYLKANYQVTTDLSLYGDVQYRHIDYSIEGKNDTWDWNNGEMQNLDVHQPFHFFNPKAGLFYQLNKENNVFGSFAVAHREPNRNNYTDAAINEVPQSERLLDYEVGYKFNNRIFAAGVNLYYMDYKDQLVLTGKVNEIGEPLTSNVPDSYRMGIELLLGAQITNALKWNGNLTLSRNKIKNYTEYVLVDDGYAPQQADYYGTTNIAYSPDVIANSLFTYRYKSFNAGFQSTYVSKQYLDNTGNDDRSIDSYFVSNLRLGYDFRLKGIKELSVNLLINNFFNAEYETNGWVWAAYYHNDKDGLDPYVEKSYFPQAGTNIMTNFILKF